MEEFLVNCGLSTAINKFSDIELSGSTKTAQNNSTRKRSSTDDLLFVEGQSNPAVFLKEFEKCDDTKTEKEKLFKIRNFVNQEDKQAFSKLFFTSELSTARVKFLKKYSLAFTTNKKKELDFRFEQDTSLRSFMCKKMKALSTYTRLSFENQLDIILNELPVEVSNLFIVHDKINCTKKDLLEFCDSIQEIMEDMNNESDRSVTLTVDPIERNQCMQDLEIFDSETMSEIVSSEINSSELESSEPEKATSGRNVVKKNLPNVVVVKHQVADLSKLKR
ncbi:hypothetical protein Bhyg_13153 [Pseudolycoriella hygida]|uniref:Uncharacterized protein n=1 Tax=Pseudolycoriella hygida TaxID=35572 RepID=A0A9Q0MPQ3_9DIPT|nr:hypothetical protein Bhyg_13153 [Pseudolycoriella hygida]